MEASTFSIVTSARIVAERAGFFGYYVVPTTYSMTEWKGSSAAQEHRWEKPVQSFRENHVTVSHQ